MTQGTLELEGPCLRIRSEWGSDLVVWPFGFSYRRRGTEITVYDEDGDVWGSVGNEVILGGGQSGRGGRYPGALGREFGKACRGPYWIGSK